MSMPALSVPPALLFKIPSLVSKAGGPREDLSVFAPYSGELIGHIPLCNGADVEAAVERARAAQAEWAARSFRERSAIFLRFHDLLLNRQNEALDLIQL